MTGSVTWLGGLHPRSAARVLGDDRRVVDAVATPDGACSGIGGQPGGVG
jgi:hypothetical protein